MLQKNTSGGYVVATFELAHTRTETVDRIRQVLAEKGWKFHSFGSSNSIGSLVMIPPVLWRESDPVAHDRIDALVERIRTPPTPSFDHLAAHSIWASTDRPRPGVKAATIQQEARGFAKRVLDLVVDVDDLEAIVRQKQAKIESLEQTREHMRDRERILEARLAELRGLEKIHAEYRALLLKAHAR